MSNTRNEITIEIGNLIGASANESAKSWQYAAFMFNAQKKGGTSYLYLNEERLSLELRKVRKELRTNFLRLREITRVDGDDYWDRCLAAIRYEDREFRMLFEFEDKTRWEITPANAQDAYKLVIGDIFPEDFE